MRQFLLCLPIVCMACGSAGCFTISRVGGTESGAFDWNSYRKLSIWVEERRHIPLRKHRQAMTQWAYNAEPDWASIAPTQPTLAMEASGIGLPATSGSLYGSSQSVGSTESLGSGDSPSASPATGDSSAGGLNLSGPGDLPSIPGQSSPAPGNAPSPNAPMPDQLDRSSPPEILPPNMVPPAPAPQIFDESSSPTAGPILPPYRNVSWTEASPDRVDPRGNAQASRPASSSAARATSTTVFSTAPAQPRNSGPDPRAPTSSSLGWLFGGR